MNVRRTLPGLLVGLLGVVAATAGLITGRSWLYLPAALCSLVAGLLSLLLAERLQLTVARVDEVEERAERWEAESDQMAARAARFEAEAVAARTTLAETMRAEAARRHRTPTTSRLDGVTDLETGLFNEQFFLVTLDKRISAARRGLRPLAMIRLEVVTDLTDNARAPAKLVASALQDTLRDADTACRLDDGTFALVLEDTPENGSVWTVERVRRCLAERLPGNTLWAGVACYPAHAFDAHQILVQASQALELAKEWRQDRIEVATATDD